MCGGKFYASHVLGQHFRCPTDICSIYGNTVVPWIETGLLKASDMVSFQKYIGTTTSKEKDMCNAVKRWGVLIEPGSKSSDGSEVYYVRFDHKDKGTTDQLTRNFDTFEQALDFANKTYKELK